MTSVRAAMSNLRGFGPTARTLGIFIISLLLFLYLAQPFSFLDMQPGLDPSWQAVSAWAQRSGLVFGSEFVFTMGPLSILYHRYFDPALAIPSALLWLLFVLVSSLTFARFFSKTGWSHWALAVASVLLVSLVQFASLNSLMFFACLLLPVSVHEIRRSRTIEIFLSFAIAAFSLAKFSVFPLAIVSVVLADLMRVTRRQFPSAMLVFGLSIVGLFVATGGPLTGFVQFLVASLEMAAGYTVAMAIGGKTGEIVWWLVIAWLLVGSASFEWKQNRSASLGLLLAALGTYLFMCLKAGFVRHDGHSLMAWSGLSAAALVWALRSAGHARTFGAVLCTAIAIGSAVARNHFVFRQPIASQPAAILMQASAQVKAGFELIRSPTAWLSERQAQQTKAIEAVKRAKPLPALEGTVDMLPSAQSEIIANGLSYRPRPTVQEYTTYSSALIARNRSFFSGDRAPDYLFFQPGSIDGRHPASAEGPLWPLFLTRYQTSDWVRDYLLLKRRDVALDPVLKEGVEIPGSFETAVAFPRRGEPAFVSIDVQPNFIGRMAALLFKLPELNYELTFPDATQARYRLIPDINREGILLSPTINTAREYAMLANGLLTDFLPTAWPVTLRVTGSKNYKYFYEPAIRFRFTSVDLEPLRRAAAGNAFADKLIDQIEDLRAPKSRLKPNPPLLAVSPEGIFAHPPSAITVPVDGATRMRLGFGIRAGAYENGAQTDGVCFSVRLPDASTVLFERCLDPKTAAADRGIVEAVVDLPPGTGEVVAATTCRSNCNWGWSFWTRIRPERSSAP